MVGILLCRFFRRVSVVLVLSAVFIAGAEAVQFNQPNNQFNMVVGTESWIYWSYAVGVVTLTLGGASPNNTNFNMTIGISRKAQSVYFWPPPSIQTGLYVLQVSDSYSYARSPFFTIINYGNVTSGSPVQPTPIQPASNSVTPAPTPTPTPTASGSDNSSRIAQNVGIALGATLAASLNLGINGYMIYRAWYLPRRARKAAQEKYARAAAAQAEHGDPDGGVTNQPGQTKVARRMAFQFFFFGGRRNNNGTNTVAVGSDAQVTKVQDDERRGLLNFVAGQGIKEVGDSGGNDAQGAQKKMFGLRDLLRFISGPKKRDDPEARTVGVEEPVSTSEQDILEQNHKLEPDHMLGQDHMLEQDPLLEQDTEDPPEYVSDDDAEESGAKGKNVSTVRRDDK